MVFFGSMFIGILLFGETYPLIKEFYLAGNLGQLKLSEVFGISQGVLAFGVIIAAVIMFWIGEWAEKKFPREEY